jgi:Tfp pilus assembly protein PilF
MTYRIAAVALLVAGCATTPAPPPTPEQKPEPPPVVAPTPSKETIAVAGLMDTARSEAAAGNLAAAAASLERALRIEPRNPRLWHELARVRLKQGQHAQAENVAARSNSWAGDDKALRAENWRLIAETRRARGDTEGAQAAIEQAGASR